MAFRGVQDIRTALAQVRSLPERLRFRFYPRLAEILLDRATACPRRALSTEAPLKILVDNTILDAAVTHETRWINTRAVQWGNEVRHCGYAARVPVHARGNKTERYREICFLTGLAHLERAGVVKLYLSAELKDEQFRQPSGRFRGYGYSDHSLFSNLDTIDGWVFPTMGPKWMRLPSAAEQQRARLQRSDDDRFHSLYKLLQQQLGKKCDQDAFHIRTAERHDMYCFVTLDGPLLKATKSLAHKEPLKSLGTRVQSPSEFAAAVGLRPVSPWWLSYNDASFFVRMDHSMPEERRRRRSEYR